MSTQIINDFSLGTNFRTISWRQTIIYNSLRAFGAGLTCSLIFVLGAGEFRFLFYPLGLVLMYLFAVLPATLVVTTIAKAFPLFGLINVFMAFFIVSIGDWFVCLLAVFFPKIVPLRDPAIFSLAPVIVLLNADEMTVAGDYNR